MRSLLFFKLMLLAFLVGPIEAYAKDKHVNVILFTEAFKEAAEKFQKFHQDVEKVQSILVSVDELKKKPRTRSDKPGHDGYEKMKPEGFEIKNYDYELALKITDFLHDFGNKNQLDSVMILGNAGVIPPSYFFYNEYEKDLPAPSNVIEYTSWIGSDHYYGATDFSHKYRWAVGRVAVDKPIQALDYLEKLKKYKKGLEGKQNTNFILAGANVVHDYRVMGEMYRLALQKNNILSPMIADYNETDKRLTKEFFLKALTEEPAEFMMFFTHGMGEGIVMGDEQMVTVKDIMDLPEPVTPKVIFSPSCLNAGFDYANIPLPFDPANKHSIAEAFMMSKVAVAYIGSTRLALANVKFETEPKTGKVNIKDPTYMPDLLLKLMIAYKAGNTRLGDAFKLAHDAYMAEKADHDDPGFRAMYAAYALIGDPVLSLPPLMDHGSSKHVGLEILNSHFTEEIKPYLHLPGFTPSNHALAGPLIVQIAHGNKEITEPVNYKIVDAKASEILQSGEIKIGHVLNFKPIGEKKTFLLKSWTKPNDVVWQYFFVEKGDEADPEELQKRGNQKEVPHRPAGGPNKGMSVLPH